MNSCRKTSISKANIDTNKTNTRKRCARKNKSASCKVKKVENKLGDSKLRCIYMNARSILNKKRN